MMEIIRFPDTARALKNELSDLVDNLNGLITMRVGYLADAEMSDVG